MTDGRPKKPRDHLVAPGSFGHLGPVEWRQPQDVEWLVDLRHAEIQHAFAARVRHVVQSTANLTQAGISRGGVNLPENVAPLFEYKRLNDCLNGHRKLSVTDMGRIELVTGPILVRLKINRTVITNEKLRARFPLAVGELPDSRADEQERSGPAAEPRR